MHHLSNILFLIFFAILILLILEISYAKPEIKDADIDIQVVFEGNIRASSMTILGDKSILLLDLDKGHVNRIYNGELYPEPLLDLNVSTNGYRGALGITHYENYGLNKANSTSIFLFFTEGHKKDGEDGDPENPQEPQGNRVYKYELINDKLLFLIIY